MHHFPATYPGEKPGDVAGVRPVLYIAIPLERGEPVTAPKPGNPGREILLTAAVCRLITGSSGQLLSIRQAHSPRSALPYRPTPPDMTKTVAALFRPN